MALSPEQIAETRAAYDKHGGNYAAMSRELGLARSTLQNRMSQIRAANDDTPPRVPWLPIRSAARETFDQFTEYLKIHAPQKPRVRVKAVMSDRPSDEPIYKVLAIGDPHDKPGRDKERFAWFGAHAAKIKPDAIVCIGDMASLDSLSTHELPGSANDADRPSYHEELDSLDEALSCFHRHLPKGQIPTYITLGNHEYRAWRSANRQPKQCGDMPLRLEQVFARWQWKTRPFGEFLDLYGVDFVHVPLNVMGREMGGEHVERNAANKTMKSLVIGHTHRASVFNATKIGQQRKLTVVNLGTSLPQGVIEKYNGVSMTGWSYGLFELRIQAGQILSAKQYDMIELQEMYG